MNSIHVIQNLISDEHQDAMFYSGLIAVGRKNGKHFCLFTTDAEIGYDGNKYIGACINELASFYVICDEDIENEVDVLVDGFIYIAEFNPETLKIQILDEVSEDVIFNTYAEAIDGFKEFIG